MTYLAERGGRGGQTQPFVLGQGHKPSGHHIASSRGKESTVSPHTDFPASQTPPLTC